jgi:DNA (cytosine-5)-methyltransferase 1
MREFTAVSLFCGAGGLDMGFERAGFKTIWANDFNEDACKTHRNWSNAEVVCGDKVYATAEIKLSVRNVE